MSKQIKASGDYIFVKNSKGIEFIGKFDELYQNEDDPWGQKEDIYYHQRRLAIVNTVAELNPSSILDIGCGFGHLTQALNILVTKGVIGVDISKTAISKASKMFPDVEFKVLDIRKEMPEGKFDVIIIDGILWYILYELKDILEELFDHIITGGHIVFSQAFIENQQYGVEVIDGYEGLVQYLLKYSGRYKFIKTRFWETGTRKTDSITVLQKRG